MNLAWDQTIRLAELSRGPLSVRLEPDTAVREALARRLGLVGLPVLTADLTVRPWLDGAEIAGRFAATVEQTCGVSGEDFEQFLSAEIQVFLVPSGSPNAPQAPESAEIEVDHEGPDPPDVIEGDAIDLSAYVIEYLALEIDPFPRKPGAVFDYQPEPDEESPFAVLKRLKDREP